jgi:hypothetical protein
MRERYPVEYFRSLVFAGWLHDQFAEGIGVGAS